MHIQAHRMIICILSSFVVFTTLFGLSEGATAEVNAGCDASAVQKPMSMLLRQTLFCNYSPQTRPVVQHTNTTHVSIHLRVMFLFFNDNGNTLDIHSWTTYKWTDEHLIWEPSKYDNIDSLLIPSSSIWLPDIELYSSADLNAASIGISGRNCWLRNTGQVTCVVPTLYSAHCAGDVSRWPYDSHNCTVRVGSWTQNGAQMDVSLSGITANPENGFVQDRDWHLLSSGGFYQYLTYKNTTHPWISFHFLLQRNSDGHTATVVIPALVLVVMSLATFWLNPDSSDRIGLICVNALVSCLYLIYVNMLIPANGSSFPVILLFFRNSFLMVAAVLLLTLFERSLEKVTSYPPTWISIICSAVLASKIGQSVLILRGCGAQAEGSAFADRSEGGAVIPGWRAIVLILDHLSFVIFAVVFFVAIIAYVF